MAGAYPDAPSRRMAWDQDGTVVWWTTGTLWTNLDKTAITELTSGQRTQLNSETDDPGVSSPDILKAYQNGNGTPRPVCWVFPERRDLFGAFTWNSYSSGDPTVSHIQNVRWSSDSTNGISGTFTDYPDTWPDTPYKTWSNSLYYRIGIEVFATPATGARTFGFIFGYAQGAGLIVNSWLVSTHLYGVISTGETPDRLLFIDNDTGLEFTRPQDWGDIPRGSVWEKNILIKNNSTTLTASTNLLDFEALTGTVDTWHQIKETGGVFADTLSIASIGPGASYPTGGNVITIRLTVADTAQLGLQAARLKLTTGSWA